MLKELIRSERETKMKKEITSIKYLIKKGAKVNKSMLTKPIYNKPEIINAIKFALHKK